MTTVENNKIKPWIVVFISYFIIGLTFGYLSQYSTIEESSKRALSKLFSPFISVFLYEHGPSSSVFGQGNIDLDKSNKLPPEGSPRAPISVALITDDDLREFGVTYPVPYEFHAERLDTIAAQKPKAIFIDVLFLDERKDDTLDTLTSTLCAIHQQGTPIYLASLKDPRQPLRPEIEALVAQGCVRKVVVPKSEDAYDHNNWEYVLQQKANEGDAFADSPALAIYKQLSSQDDRKTIEHAAHNLGLLWGMSPHTYNGMWKKKVEDGGKPTALCKPEARIHREIPILSFIQNLIFDDDYAKYPSNYCNYHASFPVNFFLFDDKKSITKRLIENRIVMYGVDLQSVGDNTYSPLHGAIPGVFVHAMALDNLLAFKGKYPRADEFNFSWSAGTFFPIAMVLIASAIAALIYWRRHQEKSEAACTKSQPNSSINLFLLSIQKFYRTLSCRLGRYSDWFLRKQNETEGPLRRVCWHLCFDAFTAIKKALIFLGLIVCVLCVFVCIGWIGLHCFNLGLLSWIEYAFLPLLLETLHLGDRLANYFQSIMDAWNGSKNRQD